MAAQRWEVVGGAEKGGILVRDGRSTASQELEARLATGAVVEEVELAGDRLRYRRVSGAGPEAGWVSVQLKGKPLLVRCAAAAALEEAAQPSSPSLPAAAASGAAVGGGCTPLAPVPGADGLWEATAWDPAGHEETFGFIARACAKDLKVRAEELSARYQAGELPPCVYVERMLVAEMPRGDGVLVYCPLPLTPGLKASVDELGGCRLLVLPTSEHARHHPAWRDAYPEAALVCPAGDSMAPLLEALGVAASAMDARDKGKWPREAIRALTGASYEVLDTAGFQEIIIMHRKSKTLLTCDSIYLGCSDKQDPEGWKNFPAPEWRKLYFDVFCEKSPSLLPRYRHLLNEEQKQTVARVMQKVIEWRPERVTSARCGKTSEGGADEAERILSGHWSWCWK